MTRSVLIVVFLKGKCSDILLTTEIHYPLAYISYRSFWNLYILETWNIMYFAMCKVEFSDFISPLLGSCDFCGLHESCDLNGLYRWSLQMNGKSRTRSLCRRPRIQVFKTIITNLTYEKLIIRWYFSDKKIL